MGRRSKSILSNAVSRLRRHYDIVLRSVNQEGEPGNFVRFYPKVDYDAHNVN